MIVGIAQVVGSQRRDKNTNCNYASKFLYSLEGVLLFNLAIFIGYKIYLFCADMAEFVRYGSLPT